jgi:hypothetical protein
MYVEQLHAYWHAAARIKYLPPFKNKRIGKRLWKGSLGLNRFTFRLQQSVIPSPIYSPPRICSLIPCKFACSKVPTRARASLWFPALIPTVACSFSLWSHGRMRQRESRLRWWWRLRQQTRANSSVKASCFVWSGYGDRRHTFPHCSNQNWAAGRSGPEAGRSVVRTVRACGPDGPRVRRPN